MLFKTHRPLYRQILSEALALAWYDRKLWIFALFAGILQTGGIYDVIVTSASAMSQDARAMLAANAGIASNLLKIPALSGMPAIINFFGRIENFLFAGLILVAILVASVIAQGALVHGLGVREKNNRPRFRHCLTAGARHFWPVAFLNVITLGLTWLARFLVIVPFASSIDHPSWFSVIAYFFAFLLFLAVVFALTTVHMFGLNAILLEEYTLWDALIHVYRLFKKSWVIVVEMGMLLFVAGFVILLVALTLSVLMEIPLFLFIIFTALFHWLTLMQFAFGIGIGILFLVMIVVGAGCIVFQYAVWQRLYLRVNQGSATAKLHRWLYRLTQYLKIVGTR